MRVLAEDGQDRTARTSRVHVDGKRKERGAVGLANTVLFKSA